MDVIREKVVNCPNCDIEPLQSPYRTDEEHERTHRWFLCGTRLYFKPWNLDVSECCKLRDEMQIADWAEACIKGDLQPLVIPDTFGPED